MGKETLGKVFFVVEATWMGLTAEGHLPIALQQLRSLSLQKDLGVTPVSATAYTTQPNSKIQCYMELFS